MRPLFIGAAVLASATALGLVLARPEPVPHELAPPPRSEASLQKSTTNEPAEPAESAEGDPAEEPAHPGYALTRQDLEQGLLKVRGRAVACKDETTPALVPVKIVITTSGSVGSVQLPQQLRGTPVGECLVRALKSATFPSWAATEKVTQVEWSYPFRFDAAD